VFEKYFIRLLVFNFTIEPNTLIIAHYTNNLTSGETFTADIGINNQEEYSHDLSGDFETSVSMDLTSGLTEHNF
jgi:hypothetical protein